MSADYDNKSSSATDTYVTAELDQQPVKKVKSKTSSVVGKSKRSSITLRPKSKAKSKVKMPRKQVGTKIENDSDDAMTVLDEIKYERKLIVSERERLQNEVHQLRQERQLME